MLLCFLSYFSYFEKEKEEAYEIILLSVCVYLANFFIFYVGVIKEK
jgi:hypothetical protein